MNASISESSVDRADKLRHQADWRINPGAEDIIEKTPLRVATVILAAIVLYLRMPDLFANPQFWGEDIVFYREALQMGLSAFAQPVVGYLLVIPRIASLLASKLSPALVPAILTYASFALTLLVVWLATSPRFVAPLRPILALALVVVPAGVEVLGTITNVQWVMPVGVLILIFSEPAKSRAVLGLEILFVATAMLTGPFCLFFVPILAWQTYANRDDAARKTRLLAFASLAILGAAIQAGYILADRNYALGTPGLAKDYSPSLWLTQPFRQMLAPWGWQGLGTHVVAESLLDATVAAGIVFLSFQKPFRDLKLAALALAVAIAVSGMWKYRTILTGATSRYFYILSIAIIWIACCSAPRSRLLAAIAGVVLMLEAAMAVSVMDTPRIFEDLEWPAQSRFISNGLPVNIPTSPPGWMFSLPAIPNRSMSDLASWQGQSLATVTKIRDGATCDGNTTSILPAGAPSLKKWQIKGAVADQDPPARAIVLVNNDSIVIGIGLTGFKTSAANQTGWSAIFAAEPGSSVRAYVISSQGNEACRIPGDNVV